MDLEKLKELYIDLKKSQREIASELNVSQTTVRYHLLQNSISRRKKHDYTISGTKTCSKCKLVKNFSDFYRKKNNAPTSYCKECNLLLSKERNRSAKEECISFLGGKCISCGFNKYVGALEFHHLDPKSKDFEISKRYREFNDAIKKELSKCVLLCSNCHKMVHAGVISVEGAKS